MQWKLASLPRALKPDEVQRLLAVLPYGRMPRRGYAIVRCALDMGLRASEIANLSVDDVDWRKGTVTLKGRKIATAGHPAAAADHRTSIGGLP